jgi:hypothetical protein
MPSAKQQGWLRDHPVIVVSTAATLGVLLGGFVAVQVLAPPHPVEPKYTAKSVAETTGAAPAGDVAASSECESQTWPHLSRECMEDYRNRHRTARVIATGRIDKPVPVAAEPPPSPAETQPVPPAAATPVLADPAPPAAEQASTVSYARPEPMAAAADTKVNDAREEKKSKQAAKPAKRKPKAKTKAPRETDDDDTAVASADAEELAEDRKEARRPDRSRRIVERWTERDYDVPSGDGRGSRRVTVIRRSGSGMFESLLGD